MMFDIVDSISDKLLDTIALKIKSSIEFEIKSYNAKYTADVIANCAFGLESKCKDHKFL